MVCTNQMNVNDHDEYYMNMYTNINKLVFDIMISQKGRTANQPNKKNWYKGETEKSEISFQQNKTLELIR